MVEERNEQWRQHDDQTESQQPAANSQQPIADSPLTDLPPRRQHPAWIFLSAIRQLRGLALPFVVLFFSGGRRDEEWVLVVGGALTLIGVVGRTVAWWQFRYEVRGGELRVHSGLVQRQERFVPLERIQAVDVSETPLQRLLGVVGVRVETAAAAGGAADVRLDAVSRAEAERLRQRLALARPTVVPTEDGESGQTTAPPGRRPARLSPGGRDG